MPALAGFVTKPSEQNFLTAQRAYRSVCEGRPVWGRQCNALLLAAGLSVEDIAFTNALPWRTRSKSAFSPSVAERAASLYVQPLMDEFGVSRAARSASEYHPPMKVATGTVVNGTVKVNDPQLEDGTEVFIVTREREEDVHLSAEERAELEAGIAEADRGEMLSGEEFFSRLRRYG